MVKYRLIITEVADLPREISEAGTVLENKVFEQCFENLDLTTLILAVNKRPRTRKQRESKPKA